MEPKTFSDLIVNVKKSATPRRMAVAVAADVHTLEAVIRARNEGLVSPILVGDGEKMGEILTQLGASVDPADMIDEKDVVSACRLAVQLVGDGRADFLMKGKVDTSVLLKAVVDKSLGLNVGGMMSHVAIFQLSSYHKLLVAVDGGMVSYPDLQQKKVIVENTVAALAAMGYRCPKVGAVTCTEKVHPKMPETLEALALKEMNVRGEISGCILEGPISYDCAVSGEIAVQKEYESPVAGDVDVVLFPNIHAGNILGKALLCQGGAKMAGFVTGAKCPIVLCSRGASAEEKFLSIAVSAAASRGE